MERPESFQVQTSLRAVCLSADEEEEEKVRTDVA